MVEGTQTVTEAADGEDLIRKDIYDLRGDVQRLDGSVSELTNMLKSLLGVQ